MSEHEFYENQTRMQYRLLGHEGSWTQGRCLDTKTKKIISQPLLKGEQEVVNWAKAQNGKGNVFIGRAARDADGKPTFSKCLSLDIDPQREPGTAASEDQVSQALACAKSVQQKFHDGILSTSGNGALLLFPTAKALDKDETDCYGKALEQQARGVLQGEPVNVDATWDFARLVKVLGTISVKGSSDLWRHARFIDSGVRPGHSASTILERLESAATLIASKASLSPLQPGELSRSKSDSGLPHRSQFPGIGSNGPAGNMVAPSKPLGWIAGELAAIQPGNGEYGRTRTFVRVIGGLKARGHSPVDVYGLLKPWAEKYDFQELESLVADQYERYPQKEMLNANPRLVSSSGYDEKPLKLWTPQNGAEQYKQRSTGRDDLELAIGIRGLDESLRGIRRSHILTVGARTDCGKTAFAIGAAVANCKAGKRVLYFSTENEYEEIWDRYFATATGISAYRIQDGSYSGLHREAFLTFTEEFRTKHQFAVYDGARPSLFEVTKALDEYKPDLVIFDYFQHFEQKDARLLAEFVMRVHELVRERKIACLMTAMAHDRWDIKTRRMLPISMGDIKDCHTIQDESRTVLLLDWDRDAVVGDGPAAVKCVVAKNKGKRDGLVLRLDRTIPRFCED